MILFQRPGHEVKLNAPMEVSWDEVVSNALDADCVEMNSNEFAYILYTSGTTGTPFLITTCLNMPSILNFFKFLNSLI